MSVYDYAYCTSDIRFEPLLDEPTPPGVVLVRVFHHVREGAGWTWVSVDANGDPGEFLLPLRLWERMQAALLHVPSVL